eukprot:876010-Pleurochrysis_carterae.AAC.1
MPVHFASSRASVRCSLSAVSYLSRLAGFHYLLTLTQLNTNALVQPLDVWEGGLDQLRSSTVALLSDLQPAASAFGRRKSMSYV